MKQKRVTKASISQKMLRSKKRKKCGDGGDMLPTTYESHKLNIACSNATHQSKPREINFQFITQLRTFFL